MPVTTPVSITPSTDVSIKTAGATKKVAIGASIDPTNYMSGSFVYDEWVKAKIKEAQRSKDPKIQAQLAEFGLAKVDSAQRAELMKEAIKDKLDKLDTLAKSKVEEYKAKYATELEQEDPLKQAIKLKGEEESAKKDRLDALAAFDKDPEIFAARGGDKDTGKTSGSIPLWSPQVRSIIEKKYPQWSKYAEMPKYGQSYVPSYEEDADTPLTQSKYFMFGGNARGDVTTKQGQIEQYQRNVALAKDELDKAMKSLASARSPADYEMAEKRVNDIVKAMDKTTKSDISSITIFNAPKSAQGYGDYGPTLSAASFAPGTSSELIGTMIDIQTAMTTGNAVAGTSGIRVSKPTEAEALTQAGYKMVSDGDTTRWIKMYDVTAQRDATGLATTLLPDTKNPLPKDKQVAFQGDVSILQSPVVKGDDIKDAARKMYAIGSGQAKSNPEEVTALTNTLKLANLLEAGRQENLLRSDYINNPTKENFNILTAKLNILNQDTTNKQSFYDTLARNTIMRIVAPLDIGKSAPVKVGTIDNKNIYTTGRVSVVADAGGKFTPLSDYVRTPTNITDITSKPPVGVRVGNLGTQYNVYKDEKGSDVQISDVPDPLTGAFKAIPVSYVKDLEMRVAGTGENTAYGRFAVGNEINGHVIANSAESAYFAALDADAAKNELYSIFKDPKIVDQFEGAKTADIGDTPAMKDDSGNIIGSKLDIVAKGGIEFVIPKTGPPIPLSIYTKSSPYNKLIAQRTPFDNFLADIFKDVPPTQTQAIKDVFNESAKYGGSSSETAVQNTVDRMIKLSKDKEGVFEITKDSMGERDYTNFVRDVGKSIATGAPLSESTIKTISVPTTVQPVVTPVTNVVQPQSSVQAQPPQVLTPINTAKDAFGNVVVNVQTPTGVMGQVTSPQPSITVPTVSGTSTGDYSNIIGSPSKSDLGTALVKFNTGSLTGKSSGTGIDFGNILGTKKKKEGASVMRKAKKSQPRFDIKKQFMKMPNIGLSKQTKSSGKSKKKTINIDSSIKAEIPGLNLNDMPFIRGKVDKPSVGKLNMIRGQDIFKIPNLDYNIRISKLQKKSGKSKK